jgi:stage III sporulation protein AD
MVVSIVSGVAVLGMLFGELTGVIEALSAIASKFSIDSSLFTTALKITGVAYIGEFGVQACKDAGEGAIASKVELGAKVIILAMCIPLVLDILTLFSTIIP